MSRKQVDGPSATRWARFRRLLAYYLECIREDQRPGSRLAVQAARPDYVVLQHAKEWSLLEGAAAEPRIRPSEMHLVSRTQLRRNSAQLFYGYPVLASWEPDADGNPAPFLLPMFEQPVEAHAGNGYPAFRLVPDWPRVNREALQRLFGSTEEQNEVLEQLGLVEWSSDLPEVRLADVVRKLAQLPVELPVIEPLDPEGLVTAAWPGTLGKTGLLNRGILFAAEPSRYTAGLERELKELAAVPDAMLDRTALAPLFSDDCRAAAAPDPVTLVEVRGLNAEQRGACERALRQPLTVVTGPPGTGKSQVVLNVLANAFLHAKPVLFSSRNRKAVSVVEERLNGLVRAPIVLRLGSQDGLAERLVHALTGLLSTAAHPIAGALLAPMYEEYARVLERRNRLEAQLDEIRQARNEAGRLDKVLDEWRLRFSEEELATLAGATGLPSREALDEALRLLARHAGGSGGMLQAIRRPFDLRRAARLLTDARGPLERLARPKQRLDADAVEPWKRYAEALREATLAADAVSCYRRALEGLVGLGAVDALAFEWNEARHKSWNLGRNILETQRSGLGLLLDGETRQIAGQLRAVAQRLQDQPTGSRTASQLRKQIRELLPRVTRFLPAWAVTNLSAPGALPFEAAMFDLAVIDEASQCDIPSALPLLFRARRAVVIGDPQQLRHIATIPPARENQLASKHALTEAADQPFTFINNSLFDLAAGTRGADMVVLRDHFRSHPDIVGFSNEHWYRGGLRVVTDLCGLELPPGASPGVQWTQVSGEVFRPEGGGAIAPAEADRVVSEVVALVRRTDFKGTVGVVSPFRGQTNRIREKLARLLDPAALQRVDLIADTAHGFQGDERDVIVFSPCVGSPMPHGARRFLAKTANVFNVAVTRARAQLHVVGDLEACMVSGIPHVEAFARHVERLRRRAETTDPSVGPFERRLEEALRAAGLAPVPQYAFGPYRLDLAVVEDGLRIDVEVDGVHFHEELDGSRCHEDLVRDAYLSQRGWIVVRFWAVEVRDRLESCVQRVLDVRSRPTTRRPRTPPVRPPPREPVQ
ncbi:AAA domain-containing protein [Anaeromyxobacter sp. SG66]|uniref:AAA domain-containing protein n=1 Tax=Anaeromyxobacter sp. SG66 TaxID=2925410 RepID=UPI001F55FDF8|nr:AAA domain-containing protein [Anaeromyxobacter sp. SG66]